MTQDFRPLQDFIAEWRSGAPLIGARTSGSTGHPKEIWLRREDMILSARRTMSFFNLSGGARLHSCVSPEFIGGKMMVVRGEVTGARYTFEPPSNHPLQSVPSREKIDLLSVVPSQMVSLLDRMERDSGLLPHIGNILIGGSPINQSLRARIAASGMRCWESYGMTETCSHIALRKVAADPLLPFSTLPGIRVVLSSEGTLTIHNALSDRTVIHTNDLAQVFSDDSFLISGRKDNVIVTGGKKVHPEHVENRLLNFDALLSEIIRRYEAGSGESGPLTGLLVSSAEDALWGEAVAYVVEMPGTECLKESDARMVSEVRDALRAYFPPEELPKRIFLIPSLPKTPNGKPDRPSLRSTIRKIKRQK